MKCNFPSRVSGFFCQFAQLDFIPVYSSSCQQKSFLHSDGFCHLPIQEGLKRPIGLNFFIRASHHKFDSKLLRPPLYLLLRSKAFD